jgi:hypothetical protein
MKKITIAIVVLVVAGSGILFLLARQKTILPPSVMAEHFAPSLISDEAWRESISRDPTAHGYSGYGILQKRSSDAAIQEGLRDLRSDDAYVWMNAASYLGSRNRPEAVPYLIKALRHTAWRSDDERVKFLRQLTGQSFGSEFEKWRDWYESQPNRADLDWNLSLGHSPRIANQNTANQASQSIGTIAPQTER